MTNGSEYATECPRENILWPHQLISGSSMLHLTLQSRLLPYLNVVLGVLPGKGLTFENDRQAQAPTLSV